MLQARTQLVDVGLTRGAGATVLCSQSDTESYVSSATGGASYRMRTWKYQFVFSIPPFSKLCTRLRPLSTYPELPHPIEGVSWMPAAR